MRRMITLLSSVYPSKLKAPLDFPQDCFNLHLADMSVIIYRHVFTVFAVVTAEDILNGVSGIHLVSLRWQCWLVGTPPWLILENLHKKTTTLLFMTYSSDSFEAQWITSCAISRTKFSLLNTGSLLRWSVKCTAGSYLTAFLFRFPPPSNRLL